jgi:hypothetical protein
MTSFRLQLRAIICASEVPEMNLHQKLAGATSVVVIGLTATVLFSVLLISIWHMMAPVTTSLVGALF